MARDAGVELRETLVPAMEPASLEMATTEAIRSLKDDVVGLSVLGVGAGTAKLTIDDHRAVDVQLNAFPFMTPAKYKSITAEQIAKAMIDVIEQAGEFGCLSLPEMMALNRG